MLEESIWVHLWDQWKETEQLCRVRREPPVWAGGIAQGGNKWRHLCWVSCAEPNDVELTLIAFFFFFFPHWHDILWTWEQTDSSLCNQAYFWLSGHGAGSHVVAFCWFHFPPIWDKRIAVVLCNLLRNLDNLFLVELFWLWQAGRGVTYFFLFFTK